MALGLFDRERPNHGQGALFVFEVLVVGSLALGNPYWTWVSHVGFPTWVTHQGFSISPQVLAKFEDFPK